MEPPTTDDLLLVCHAIGTHFRAGHQDCPGHDPLSQYTSILHAAITAWEPAPVGSVLETYDLLVIKLCRACLIMLEGRFRDLSALKHSKYPPLESVDPESVFLLNDWLNDIHAAEQARPADQPDEMRNAWHRITLLREQVERLLRKVQAYETAVRADRVRAIKSFEE